MLNESLPLFITVSLGLLIVPGPLVMLTISTTLQHRISGALWLTLGFVCSGIIKALLAMAGVATLLQVQPHLLALLQFCGALYLLWLAWQLLQPSTAAGNPQNAADKPTPKRQLFLRGLMSALANPKGILFFAALFPQFISPLHPLWSQTLNLVMIFSLLEMSVMLGYAGVTAGFNRGATVSELTRTLSQRLTPAILSLVSGMMLWDLFNLGAK